MWRHFHQGLLFRLLQRRTEEEPHALCFIFAKDRNQIEARRGELEEETLGGEQVSEAI